MYSEIIVDEAVDTDSFGDVNAKCDSTDRKVAIIVADPLTRCPIISQAVF